MMYCCQLMTVQNVGILGGGQLARMLVEAAIRLGITPIPFCKNSHEPAALISPTYQIGSEDDIQALSNFLARIDLLIFENEFSRFDCVAKALSGRNLACQPSLSTMIELSDKSKQKEQLQNLGIPTAEFFTLQKGAELDAWIEQSLKAFPAGAVFKWGERGYDGKGILVTDQSTDRGAIREFANQALSRGYAVYTEKRIDFIQELAIIGCRSICGEYISYPLVCCEQKNGICSLVTGPAVALGVSESQAQQAREIAELIAHKLNLYGCFGIEFFQDRNGALLVNEIAPRVHNSGHYTQDACVTSQFENHLRATLGMPLGSIAHSPAFAMYNLLGPEDLRADVTAIDLPIPSGEMKLHWYGKSSISPRRKVGHLNCVVDNVAQLPALCDEFKKCESEWIERLRRTYAK